jgi:hypothetical protein
MGSARVAVAQRQHRDVAKAKGQGRNDCVIQRSISKLAEGVGAPALDCIGDVLFAGELSTQCDNHDVVKR